MFICFLLEILANMVGVLWLIFAEATMKLTAQSSHQRHVCPFLNTYQPAVRL